MARTLVLRGFVSILIVLLGSGLALPPAPAAADGPNVLANFSFEEGMHRTSLSSWVSDGWNPWFEHGGLNPAILREPEFAVRNRPKEAHHGSWSMSWFNSYGTHNGGIYQTVRAPKGATATFSIWMIGHSAKEDVTQLGPSTSVYKKWVGIDPYGGTDWRSPNIVWVGPNEVSDKYVQMVVTATVQSDAVTVFTRGQPDFPVKNNATVVDDASLTFSSPKSDLPPPPAEPAAPGLEGEKMEFGGGKLVVAGAWLEWYLSHGGSNVLGKPLSNAKQDPAGSGYAQYFEKAVLDWQVDGDGNPYIQKRLLGDLLYPDNAALLSEDQAPSGNYAFLLMDDATGGGHFVANFTADGQPLYFLDFFRRNGGVAEFGYPKEEPQLREGKWTQRFQMATFTYEPGNDIDGYIPGTETLYRDFVVSLDNLGEKFVAARKIKLN